MRAPLTAAALVALAALLPASAAAHVPTIYPQDISLTGQVIASSSATERTLRFTITNHGPAASPARQL